MSCSTVAPQTKVEYIPVYKKVTNICVKPTPSTVCKINDGEDDFSKFYLLSNCILQRMAEIKELRSYIRCLEQFFEDNDG